MTAPVALPSAARIAEAAGLIDPVFLDSPQFESDALNARLGLRLVCKAELANPIRSFKGRGADYCLQRLGGGVSRLVCASAGNFGQGLAYAARKRGVPLTVFAATTANPLKIEAMRRLGAEVRLAGADFDAAKDAARAFAAGEGVPYIEDGALASIAEGAGTIALELERYAAPIDVMLVPLGNGALVNGIGTWCRAHLPRTRVVAVAAAGAPAMERSWRSATVVTTETVDTIADGIAVRVPVPAALEAMKHVVDEVLLVDDGAIREAMRLAFDTLGLVVEPAGVAGLAAALTRRNDFAGQVVATPLCGGNLTGEQVQQWLCQGA